MSLQPVVEAWMGENFIGHVTGVGQTDHPLYPARSGLSWLVSRHARRNARNRYYEWRFLTSPPSRVASLDARMDKAIIATIAFNRPDVIEWQAHLIKKHLAERDSYIVFDNSNDPVKRSEIERLCASGGVPYVALPANKFTTKFTGSPSHGHALNWIAKNFVARYRPAMFGFLDHDIFPTGPFSLVEKMSGVKCYGRENRRAQGWHLWAGFCFFELGLLPHLNFLPFDAYELDTGGGSWLTLFRDIPAADYRLADFSVRQVKDGDHPHNTSFQMIDGWVHAMNASDWSGHAGDRSDELTTILKAASGEGAPTVRLERI